MGARKVLVVGLGVSGEAAARFLQKRRNEVIAVDENDTPSLRAAAENLRGVGVEVHLGQRQWPTDVDLVVASPGVPPAKFQEFKERKIPVIGEIELGCREIDVPIIAVTGTNGKSSVVTSIEKTLNRAGKMARAIGNLGIPLTDWIERDEPADFLVLEMSSYQLETVKEFRPRVAIILNVAPDHLHWHGSMDAYLKAKARITRKQTIEDSLLLYKDLEIHPQLQKTRAKLYWFGKDLDPSREGVSLAGDTLSWRGEGTTWSRSVSVENLFPHEIDNYLAALAALMLVGIAVEDAVRIFDEPVRLAHRLETVATIRGITFFNDSKATNAHAAKTALEAISREKIWLVGGEAKGEDLGELVSAARERGVHLAVCFGKDRELFRSALEPDVLAQSLPTLREAFVFASKKARQGDVVLLSPAGASFDEFSSFEERGNCFKQWVWELKENAA